MFKRKVALLAQRQHAWERSSGRFPAPDGKPPSPCERPNRGVFVPASGSGSHGGSSGKQVGGRGGGAGGGSGGGGGVEGGRPPGQPIILKPEEAARRVKSGPLARSSYRRRKEKAEESRRQRAEYLAELSAASKRARVSYVGGSSPAPLGPRVALVDGYNVIHASEELSRLADFRLQDARQALNRMAAAFAAAYGMRVYVVYDAMGSHSPTDRLERLGPQALAVFSVASEADTYIGQAAVHWKRKGAQEVMVVSNDRYVQDLAADQDYVIYPVNLNAWLEQAHRATLAPSPPARAPPGQPGSGPPAPPAAGPSATAEWLPRAGAAARRGAPGGGDEDEDEDAVQGSGAGSHTSGEARGARGLLRSSRELHEELLWLASSSEEDEGEGEGAEVDYLAALEEEEGWYYTAKDWRDGGAEGQGKGSDLERDEAAGPGQSIRTTAVTAAAASGGGSHVNSSGGSSSSSSSGSGAQEQQQPQQMTEPAAGSAAPTDPSTVSTATPLSAAAAAAALSAASPSPPSPPAAADAAATPAAAAAAVATAAPASSPAVPSPAPAGQPPAAATPASQPVNGLSGLLGKGGKSKLAGLVKRATRDLDVKP